MALYKNFKYLGGWAGKSAMADATKTTARHIGHMTYTQAPAVYEKNIFHLFRFTQPVKNYSFHICNRIVGIRATIYIPTPTTPCHRVQRLSKLNTVIILIECIQGDHMTDAKKINIYIHHY